MVSKGEGTFKSLTTAHAVNPKDVVLITKLAGKYYDRGESQKAMALYKEVVALDPEGKMGQLEDEKNVMTCTEFAEFKLGWAACYIGQGVPRSAAPLEAFLLKYPSSKFKKEAYSSLAIFYSSSQADMAAAETFFERAFALYPDDPWLRYYYVAPFVYGENKENLDRAIEIAEGMKPFGHTQVASTLAELYLKKGDLVQAGAVYGKDFMEGQYSSYANALASYASFWTEKKTNLESAEKMILAAIEMAPESANYRQAAASLYLDQGKTDKAIELYGPAFIRDSKVDAYGLTNYSRFWIQKKLNLESAEEALDKAAASAAAAASTTDRISIQNAANLFYQLGKPDRALRVFGPEFIKNRMDDPLVLSSYARFWAAKNTNLESALVAAEALVKLKDAYAMNMASYWNVLATVYLNLGRLEEALKAEEKALELDVGVNREYFRKQLNQIQAEIEKKKK
jgi:tetratricopeptide (TPR) repeat protein